MKSVYLRTQAQKQMINTKHSNQHQIQTDRIRQLDLQTALERYGVQFDNHGFAPCPFHGETQASFYCKNGFWYCFGCNAHGDLIDFVRRSAGLSFVDTVRKISTDFGLSSEKPTKFEKLRSAVMQSSRQAEAERTERVVSEWLEAFSAWLAALDAEHIAAKCADQSEDAGFEHAKAIHALTLAEENLRYHEDRRDALIWRQKCCQKRQ